MPGTCHMQLLDARAATLFRGQSPFNEPFPASRTDPGSDRAADIVGDEQGAVAGDLTPRRPGRQRPCRPR